MESSSNRLDNGNVFHNIHHQRCSPRLLVEFSALSASGELNAPRSVGCPEVMQSHTGHDS